MVSKKIIVSKINAIGAMRQNLKSLKTTDQPSGNALRKIFCSKDNDNVTTYVQKKEWVISLNDFLFPPYVDCEYVQ
jgi:hypothetical protein